MSVKTTENHSKPPLLAKQGKKLIRAWPVNPFLVRETKRMAVLEEVKSAFGSYYVGYVKLGTEK